MQIDLSQIPFSMPGSYMAISYHPAKFRGMENQAGIFLRTIHYTVQTPLVCQIIPTIDGEEVAYTYEETPSQLKIQTEQGNIGICFENAETLIFQGNGDKIGLKLDFMSSQRTFDYFYEVPIGQDTLYMAECFKNNCKYLLDCKQGALEIRQHWHEESSAYAYYCIDAQQGGFCFTMKELFRDWNGVRATGNFTVAETARAKEFDTFYQSMPTVPEAFEEARKTAAYVNWESIVKKCGFLTRDTMLMSKNWMAKVWSWDHCFNAIALSYQNPQDAWNQFILMFDLQQPTGVIPDSVTDSEVIWNYCKPPIHGWALGKMMEHMALSDEQVQQAYQCLSNWTNWWLNHRDRNQNGICEYTHGNDSGWDNATAFNKLPPVETPDLQAFLVLQMEMLAKLAGMLNRAADQAYWQKQAKQLLDRMIALCFDKAGNPQSVCAYSRELIPNDSLIMYLPIILGNRLPKQLQQKMLAELKSDRFLTEWGYATESPQSAYYVSDGYWRGPIWAPSTMLLLDGLYQSGEKELVQRVTTSFAKMVSKSGCAENFDARTGEGLRDRAYTWTSSAFLVMVHEYLTEE